MFVTLMIKNEEKRFLRTGDLGFVHENQLYITGRIKDLIIIRGINYYPQDFEHSITASFKEIKQGSCVVFSANTQGNESLGIIFETLHLNDGEEIKKLFTKIKQLIMEEHQLLVGAIYNVKPKSIIKTTSGKIERAANINAVLNNEISILFSDVN